MPVRMWKHECCGGSSNESSCSSCGVVGKYDGWYYTMHEKMARFQYMTGMKPFGPHRELTDRLLLNNLVKCASCGGRGLLHVNDTRYALCAPCEAMGYFWSIPPEEIESIRRQILAEYPDAEAPRGGGRFDRRPMVLDLARGEMLTDE
jgi:hypothetical protein